jgi:hypothetical protein
MLHTLSLRVSTIGNLQRTAAALQRITSLRRVSLQVQQAARHSPAFVADARAVETPSPGPRPAPARTGVMALAAAIAAALGGQPGLPAALGMAPAAAAAAIPSPQRPQAQQQEPSPGRMDLRRMAMEAAMHEAALVRRTPQGAFRRLPGAGGSGSDAEARVRRPRLAAAAAAAAADDDDDDDDDDGMDGFYSDESAEDGGAGGSGSGELPPQRRTGSGFVTLGVPADAMEADTDSDSDEWADGEDEHGDDAMDADGARDEFSSSSSDAEEDELVSADQEGALRGIEVCVCMC